ncbi:glycosyltransferase [Parvularcula sp. IMCC14364]|uniref:glycosyltransferase n=1 Tax=Parvularcula sp. IMCC14364 TaxID=3067902 RepID=UPI0027410225|nr:glycosyltransferase [Parvularcula sp. IMCC14364]
MNILHQYISSRGQRMATNERLFRKLCRENNIELDARLDFNKIDERIHIDNDVKKNTSSGVYFSIIIPAYNVSEYIDDCIYSLRNQTFENIEIIVVDDCGQDDTADKILMHLISDDRVVYVKNRFNLGLLRARQSGAAFVKGQYIGHLDADDWLSNNALDACKEICTKKKPDILQFGMSRILDGNEELHDPSTPPAPELSASAIFLSFLDRKINFSVCNKLYKRSLWERASKYFPKVSYRVEDLSQNQHLLQLAKSYIAIDDQFYKYRITAGSDSRSPTIESISARAFSAARHIARLKKYLRSKDLLVRFWPEVGAFEKSVYYDYVRRLISTWRNASGRDKLYLWKSIVRICRINGFLPLRSYFCEYPGEMYDLLNTAYASKRIECSSVDVSIVVPVYGTEEYIAQCLSSICSQSLKNIEIIVVIDASPDNSIQIVKDYAQLDPRVQIICHDKNKGLLQARLTGVRAAKGRYIAHCDSDDEILPNMLEEMLQAARRSDADIVQCGYSEVYDRRIRGLLVKKRFTSMGGDTFRKFLELDGVSNSMWNKLYRRELWLATLPYMPDITYKAEDVVQNTLLMAISTKLVHVPVAFYRYLIRENSGDRVQNPSQIRFRAKSAIHNMRFIEYVVSSFNGSRYYSSGVIGRYKNYFHRMMSPFAHFATGKGQSLDLEIESLEEGIPTKYKRYIRRICYYTDLYNSSKSTDLLELPTPNSFGISEASLDIFLESAVSGTDSSSVLELQKRIQEAIVVGDLVAFRDVMLLIKQNYPERNFHSNAIVDYFKNNYSKKTFKIGQFMNVCKEIELIEEKYVIMSKYALARKIHAEAKSLALAAYEIDPNNHSVIRTYAEVLYREDNAEEAYRISKSLTNLQPNNPEYYLFTANVLKKLSMHREGITFAEEALRLKPGYEAALATLGQFQRIDTEQLNG